MKPASLFPPASLRTKGGGELCHRHFSFPATDLGLLVEMF